MLQQYHQFMGKIFTGASTQRCSYEKLFGKYAANLQANMPKCDFNKSCKVKQSNFIEIILWHGCSPVYLIHIFRTPLPRNTSGWLLLCLCREYTQATKDRSKFAFSLKQFLSPVSQHSFFSI